MTLFASSLSASSSAWAVDVAIVAVLVLFLVGGIVKGLSRSTKGFFVFIFVVLASLFCMSLTHETMMESAVGEKIEAALTKSSEGWGVAFNSPVIISEDGSMTVMVDGDDVDFGDIKEGTKRNIAKWLAKQFVENSGETVAQAIVYNLTSLIVSVILFFIFVIALCIALALIKLITRSFRDSGSTALHAVDRILGAVFCLFIGVIFIAVVFAVFSALETKVPSIAEYVRSSTLGKFIYEHNPIGEVLQKIFARR